MQREGNVSIAASTQVGNRSAVSVTSTAFANVRAGRVHGGAIPELPSNCNDDKALALLVSFTFLLHFLRGGCSGTALPVKTSDGHGHWKLNMLATPSCNLFAAHTDGAINN